MGELEFRTKNLRARYGFSNGNVEIARKGDAADEYEPLAQGRVVSGVDVRDGESWLLVADERAVGDACRIFRVLSGVPTAESWPVDDRLCTHHAEITVTATTPLAVWTEAEGSTSKLWVAPLGRGERAAPGRVLDSVALPHWAPKTVAVPVPFAGGALMVWYVVEMHPDGALQLAARRELRVYQLGTTSSLVHVRVVQGLSASHAEAWSSSGPEESAPHVLTLGDRALLVWDEATPGRGPLSHRMVGSFLDGQETFPLLAEPKHVVVRRGDANDWFLVDLRPEGAREVWIHCAGR